MSTTATAPGASSSSTPRVSADRVRWLSIEGGGAAGMTVHPGALNALEQLKVLRWDQQRRQIGVHGFVGSSSGSIVATLASCGYHAREVTALLHPSAFDLVFRTEPLVLGDGVALGGGTVKRTVTTGIAPSLMADPMSFLLASCMYGEATVAGYFTGPSVQQALKNSLQRRIERLTDRDVETRVLGPAALVADLRAEAIDALKRRIAGLTVTWATAQLVEYVKSNYPHVIALLLERLLDRTTWKFDDPRNLLTILRYDYGFYAGHRWREYIDLAVAFALFRTQVVRELPSLEVPDAADFRAGRSLQQVFSDEVVKAMRDPMAEYVAGGPVTTDYVTQFLSHRHCTFARHRALLYDFLPASAPGPLAMTGANLSSQESHVFSYDTTPDMYISDAVRISSGLPPIFKPFIIEGADIPSWWNVAADSTVQALPFLEGQWMDGGTFYNSPTEWYRPYETGGARVLALGIGQPERLPIEDVSDYYWAMFDPLARSVYERNVSATRLDPGAFIPYDNFGIGIAQPTMADSEMAYYRLEAWSRTMDFFGGPVKAPPAMFSE